MKWKVQDNIPCRPAGSTYNVDQLNNMIAIEISSFGPPDVLKPVERPKLVAKNGEVVVRVEAAGVARVDTLQRQGRYPPPPGASDIPGLDLAGTVDSVGSDVVDQFQPGDGVCAILAGGGYAEFCAVPAEQVLPIPDGWSFVEAATLPENLFTVYDNVITRAGLVRGETILIHGGSSGIGTMAIMLSRAWGATPIVTAGSDEKCAACISLGAEHAINYKQSDFVVETKRLTNNAGVNVVLDMVGGSYLKKNVEVLAPEGRLAIIATQGGRTGELDIATLMQKRARVMGSTMRARTPAQKGEVAQRLLRDVWPLLPAKDPIRPVIDKTFRLANARLAHERMESGEHIGKIILETR
ncbi:MAG: NAD(P)H-quinone oxidoreductase [Acidobacteriaceae bacterium]|nr:NAD(P)H-quinone oxidoreductase [Acidobacteriaceae bacterium]